MWTRQCPQVSRSLVRFARLARRLERPADRAFQAPRCLHSPVFILADPDTISIGALFRFAQAERWGSSSGVLPPLSSSVKKCGPDSVPGSIASRCGPTRMMTYRTTFRQRSFGDFAAHAVQFILSDPDAVSIGALSRMLRRDPGAVLQAYCHLCRLQSAVSRLSYGLYSAPRSNALWNGSAPRSADNPDALKPCAGSPVRSLRLHAQSLELTFPSQVLSCYWPVSFSSVETLRCTFAACTPLSFNGPPSSWRTVPAWISGHGCDSTPESIASRCGRGSRLRAA